VGDDCDDFASTMVHDGLGGFDERTAGIGHVVDENGNFILNVSDEDHAGDFVRAGSLFVDEGETEVKAVSDGGCSVGRKLANFEISFREKITHLLAPPASGLTTTASFTLTFSRIHLKVLGSAYKLSTGTLKKPWI